MSRDAAAPDKPDSLSDEILRGTPAIADFFGTNRKAVTAFIRAGLPVARLGNPYGTTKRLALEWFEARCRKGG